MMIDSPISKVKEIADWKYRNLQLIKLPRQYGGNASAGELRIKLLEEQREAYLKELKNLTPGEVDRLYRLMQVEREELNKNNKEVDEQTRFFNQPDVDADYDYWSKAATWSIDEAIALSFGRSHEKFHGILFLTMQKIM